MHWLHWFFLFFYLNIPLILLFPPKKTLYQIPPKRAVLNSHNNSSFNFFFIFALCLGVLSELYNFIPDSWTFYVAGQRVL